MTRPEDEFLRTIGWSKWPTTGCIMIRRCAQILKENHLRAAPVNLNGAR
jgi:hypothetical protein